MILLDTHVAIWIAAAPEKLSQAAKLAVSSRRDEGLAICDATLLELATLIRKSRLEHRLSPATMLSDLESRFSVIPISGRACLETLSLPEAFPQDPIDRIIVGTARAEGMPLVTADAAIRRSRVVETIW